MLTLLVEKDEVEGDRTVVAPLFNHLVRNFGWATLEGWRKFGSELQKDIFECILPELAKNTRKCAV